MNENSLISTTNSKELQVRNLKPLVSKSKFNYK